jgi:hypothetical protein
MRIIGGIAMFALSLLCWGGQTIVWLSPKVGVKLGLSEAEEDVEPVYWADIRGEAAWDFFTLWTMLAAALLLILDEPVWAYFGLVGGGMYVYFAGRGILTRLAMRRSGFRVGASTSLKLGYTFLSIWCLMGLVTIAAAAMALAPR